MSLSLVDRTRRFLEVLARAPQWSESNRLKLHRELGIAPTRHTVPYQERAFDLLKFSPVMPDPSALPILVVPSLINRWYILDLVDGHSTVAALNHSGQTVYVVAWKPAHEGQGERPLAHFVEGYLRRAATWVKRQHGVAPAVLGQCLGGTLALALAARHPELVSRLAALTTPVDFAQGGRLATWTHRDVVNLDVIGMAHPGVLPDALVYGAFPLLDPKSLLSRHRTLFKLLDFPAFVQLYEAIDLWTRDHLPVASRALRDTISLFYRDNALLAESWTVSGGPVRLSDIVCPVLCAYAEADDIVTPASAKALLGAVPHAIPFASPLGHVTLVVASPARFATWAALSAFLHG